MGFITVFLIAVGLAMDAFAVSVSNGMVVKNLDTGQKIKMSGFFGAFQFIMPLVGYFVGSKISGFIEAVDHWIAFILLLIIGVNMIMEACKSDSDENVEVELTNKKLFFQAVATSIDALVIGITLAVLDVDMFLAAMIIGVVCFCLSLIGCFVGERIGGLFKGKAEILGGIILICIGAKTLIEHLFFS